MALRITSEFLTGIGKMPNELPAKMLQNAIFNDDFSSALEQLATHREKLRLAHRVVKSCDLKDTTAPATVAAATCLISFVDTDRVMASLLTGSSDMLALVASCFNPPLDAELPRPDFAAAFAQSF